MASNEMNKTSSLQASRGIAAHRSDRGAVVIVMLYALSIFSVLALTVLRNAQLETILRTGEQPDLHVVLYAGGAGSPKVVGRLNLPTLTRLLGSHPDESVEIQAPGPVGSSLTAELPEGGVYAVQLGAGLRVCCDGGNNACSELPWEQQVPEGSVTPSQTDPIDTTEVEHRLQFALSAFTLADNIDFDPERVAEAAFGLKAARVQEGSTPTENAGGTGAAVSCRLQTADKTLATGTLQVQPGVDAAGQINRVSSGSLELKYKAPTKP